LQLWSPVTESICTRFSFELFCYSCSKTSLQSLDCKCAIVPNPIVTGTRATCAILIHRAHVARTIITSTSAMAIPGKVSHAITDAQTSRGMDNPVVSEGIIQGTHSTVQTNGNARQLNECRGVSDLCAGTLLLQKFITLASIISFLVQFGFFGFI
jgi:hypothetical protein